MNAKRSRSRWGTFSVFAHRQLELMAVDILLYDRPIFRRRFHLSILLAGPRTISSGWKDGEHETGMNCPTQRSVSRICF